MASDENVNEAALVRMPVWWCALFGFFIGFLLNSSRIKDLHSLESVAFGTAVVLPFMIALLWFGVVMRVDRAGIKAPIKGTTIAWADVVSATASKGPLTFLSLVLKDGKTIPIRYGHSRQQLLAALERFAPAGHPLRSCFGVEGAQTRERAGASATGERD